MELCDAYDYGPYARLIGKNIVTDLRYEASFVRCPYSLVVLTGQSISFFYRPCLANYSMITYGAVLELIHSLTRFPALWDEPVMIARVQPILCRLHHPSSKRRRRLVVISFHHSHNNCFSVLGSYIV